MDLLSLIQTVLRRWYVVVPVLLASFGLAASVQSTVPSEYETSGSLLLEEARFDPSRLPASAVNARTLVEIFETQGVASELQQGAAQLVVQERDELTLNLTAVGSAAAPTESTVERGISWVREEAERAQVAEGIPEDERLRVAVLTPLVAAQPLENGNFEAAGVVVLRDPSAGIQNPYGAGGGTASLLIAVFDTEEGHERISQAVGSEVTFGFGTTRENQAIISLTTTGNDPSAVVEAYDEVRIALDQELDRRQARADVPPSQRIVVADLSRPGSAEDVSPPLSRAVAAIVLAGGILALGLAILVDRILRRRADRSDSRLPPQSDELQSDAWWVGSVPTARDEHDMAEPVKAFDEPATGDER